MQQPDVSGASFVEKLPAQLDDVSDDAVRLFAEVFFVQLLPAVNAMRPQTKRARLLEVLALRDPEAVLPAHVDAALEQGIANPGKPFNVLRYWQLRFLVSFAAAWKRLSSQERGTALDDPWTFRAVIEEVPVAKAQAQRELLLHLVHPNTFESIASGPHKRRIATTFSDRAGTSDDLDRKLLSIRKALSAQGGHEIDFYLDEDIRARWLPTGGGVANGPVDSPAPHLPLRLLRMERALQRKGQLALYGPPGTGKTYWALRLAVVVLLRDELDEAGLVELLDDDDALDDRADELGDPGDGRRLYLDELTRDELTARLERITFHPSYAYEDFIEGYRPERGGEGLRLVLRKGLFARMCRTAAADPDRPYVLLVDELNRADVPKVLGELITVLERDKRGHPVRLAQSGDTLRVPPNVLVIATMNTADRSVRLLDAALRRRFAFEELPPDESLLAGAVVAGIDLRAFLVELNRRVGARVGQEYRIGHSYLLDAGVPVEEQADLVAALRHDVLPQVEEVAAGEAAVLAELLGTGLVDADLGVLRAEVRDDDERLLAAMRTEFTPS